jgi:Fe-S cluster assembly protein SufD
MIETPTKQPARFSDTYWERFEQLQAVGMDRQPAWLLALRNAALARFVETGFPTVRDEDWRFTNVAPIAKLPFNPVLNLSEPAGRTQLEGLPFHRLPGIRLVFVDGQFAPEFSEAEQRDGKLYIGNLAAALEHGEPLVDRYLGKNAQSDHNAFIALNTAFFTDGSFIHVPAGVALKEPVHLVHLSGSHTAAVMAHPRHLIVAEPGSKLTVVEHYADPAGSPHLTNAVTELVLGEGAQMEHCKFQDEGLNAYHIEAIHAMLGRRCNFTAHSFALGARLSRNNIRTVLGGEGIECILNGLYLTKDDQLADHHMIVEHAEPQCNSHEYFNGILDGHSRGVFHGRILVRPKAQKTDAKQTNKNLLLSDDAGVNTKPQLEIYADDVKCTHGATIGQLNKESVFYLRARGIGEETARRMLMHAFAAEIIERIRHDAIREELDELVWNRLEQNSQIKVA